VRHLALVHFKIISLAHSLGEAAPSLAAAARSEIRLKWTVFLGCGIRKISQFVLHR
jgi:hypothetical protein